MAHAQKLPFTIGNDICRIARVRKILAGKFGRRFVRGILRPEELRPPRAARMLHFILEPSPERPGVEPDLRRAAEFMAGRFAAKEAVIKAHPHRLLSFSSIAIVRTAQSTSTPYQESMLDAFEKMGTNVVGGGTDPEKEGEGGSWAGEPEVADGKTQVQETKGPLVAVIKADGLVGHDTYASISISHDGEYATAVCLAANPGLVLDAE
ncbi:hypothetical protein F5B18DRAFT_653950 [Nemania serpens]|nr:hypothetical protein F5B18DRAFT_653950 [Nemania serpens]